MVTWQQALHVGLAPQLSTEVLIALLAEVEAGGPRLTQHAYAEPPPVFSSNPERWVPWDRCCLVGMCAALSGAGTSNEVHEEAERLATEMLRRAEDSRPAFACSLIGWFDDTPMAETLPLLAVELRGILAERQVA